MNLPAPLVAREADCVLIYRRLRDGVPATAAQIGYGYNLYPAAADVHAHLLTATAACIEHRRFAEYGTAHDSRDRALAADLASRYLGTPIEPEHLVFTNGSTEGIAITMRYLSATGTGLWLPLPTYYAFEQTLDSAGGTILGHYGMDGASVASGHTTPRSARVEIIPNGVSGSLAALPAAAVDFRIIDIVFQAGTASTATVAATRASLAAGLESAAVLMTPSKDLSLPGLRAGMLLSAHPGILQAARRKHFDDLATINPLVGQLMLLYLTGLLMADAARHNEVDACYRWLAGRFRRHQVESLPSRRTCEAITAHWWAMADHIHTGHHLLTRHAGHLLDTGLLPPAAGYSLLPALRHRVGDMEDLVRWVNTTGRGGLKLNPSLLFGGTPAVWEALYPGQRHLRVNLSVSHTDLMHTLSLLEWATSAAKGIPV